MKYLILGDTKETIVEVSLIYSVEPPKDLGEYVAVDKLPKPDTKQSNNYILCYNRDTKEIFYKYLEDITESFNEDMIENLKKEIKGCKQSIAELTALASTAMVMPK